MTDAEIRRRCKVYRIMIDTSTDEAERQQYREKLMRLIVDSSRMELAHDE